MAMEITEVLRQQPRQKGGEIATAHSDARMKARKVVENLESQQLTEDEVRRSIEELRRVTRNFNKRLSFSYSDDLGQMIVKVIDQNTDKVIKELPPAELQRVHVRIREAIGLLLDETI